MIGVGGTPAGAGDCPYPVWTGSASLRVPGSTRIGETHDLVASEEAPPTGTMVHDASVAYLDADVTGRDFLVRSRMDGDRFQPLGMEGEKKLQDCVVDELVPPEWWGQAPLVEVLSAPWAGRLSAWVVGFGPAPRAGGPSANTSTVLEIAVSRPAPADKARRS